MQRLFIVSSRLLVVWLLLTIEGTHILAQPDSVFNGCRLELKYQYGAVYPHHSSVEYVLGSNIQGFEINLSTQSTGRHMWEQLYRYPRYGVAYSFLQLGNPEILGNLHALFGYVDIPFYRSEGNFSLNYQVDIGVGYFSKTFEPYENPLNMVVSSPYNVYIGLDFTGRYKLGRNQEIKAGLELTHCSNGKTRSPNMGMNSITLSVAWLYSISPERPVTRMFVPEGYRKNFFELLANVGYKRDDNMKEETYLVSSLIGDYYYAFSPRYAFGAGVDFFYDGSIAQHQEFFDGVTPRDNSINYQYGAHVGFRVRYGRLFMSINAGKYIHADYVRNGYVYSRLGMRYALTDQIMLNLTLKAHSTIADFIEWGIGYRFNTKGI